MLEGQMQVKLGYEVGKPPRGTAYQHALDEELDRLRAFL